MEITLNEIYAQLHQLKEVLTKSQTTGTANNFQGEIIMPKPKEGTIIHRKNGLYEARIMLDGKQVYVGASKYYKEAFRKLEAARKLKQQGKYKREPKAAVRLSEWLTRWAETYKKPFVEAYSATFLSSSIQ